MKGFKKLKVLQGLFDTKRDQKPGQERRLGKRIVMRVPVQITTLDDLSWPGRVCDVNRRGLSIEPNQGVAVLEQLTVSFPAYEDVWPAFELIVVVRRLVEDPVERRSTALGIEIHQEKTSPEAKTAYGKLVLHYLRDRTLLEEQNRGRHNGRCLSCEWIGMVETLELRCPFCKSRLVPHENESQQW